MSKYISALFLILINKLVIFIILYSSKIKSWVEKKLFEVNELILNIQYLYYILLIQFVYLSRNSCVVSRFYFILFQQRYKYYQEWVLEIFLKRIFYLIIIDFNLADFCWSLCYFIAGRNFISLLIVHKYVLIFF